MHWASSRCCLLFFGLYGGALADHVDRRRLLVVTAMPGRLAGIEMLSYSVGPLGGQVRSGVVADLWTFRGSIASGGARCAGTAEGSTHRHILVVCEP
ncbi:hypothetical protein BH10ACT10_BH10ACT10_27780 [soil metagenome]